MTDQARDPHGVVHEIDTLVLWRTNVTRTVCGELNPATLLFEAPKQHKLNPRAADFKNVRATDRRRTPVGRIVIARMQPDSRGMRYDCRHDP